MQQPSIHLQLSCHEMSAWPLRILLLALRWWRDPPNSTVAPLLWSHDWLMHAESDVSCFKKKTKNKILFSWIIQSGKCFLIQTKCQICICSLGQARWTLINNAWIFANYCQVAVLIIQTFLSKQKTIALSVSPSLFKKHPVSKISTTYTICCTCFTYLFVLAQ